MSNTKQIEAITIRADILKRALKATIPAMSKDETRFHLQGLHVVFDGDDLLVEATDGHTAHRVTIPGSFVDGDRGLWHSLIIPANDAKAIMKMLPTGRKRLKEAVVNITRGGATCAGRGVVFKAIKSQFPPMSAVIPDRSRAPGAALVGVNPVYLARAAKTASDFRDGSAQSLTWSQGDNLDPILMYTDDSLGCVLDLVIMPMRR